LPRGSLCLHPKQPLHIAAPSRRQGSGCFCCRWGAQSTFVELMVLHRRYLPGTGIFQTMLLAKCRFEMLGDGHATDAPAEQILEHLNDSERCSSTPVRNRAFVDQAWISRQLRFLGQIGPAHKMQSIIYVFFMVARRLCNSAAYLAELCTSCRCSCDVCDPPVRIELGSTRKVAKQ
jgi:hypothetical protein